MTDLWNDKPESEIIMQEQAHGTSDYEVECYRKKKMDDYLSKLKAYCEVMEGKAEKWDELPYYLQKILETRRSEATMFGAINKSYLELEDKLEAVKRLIGDVENTQELLGSRWFKNSTNFKRLKEILGAEE